MTVYCIGQAKLTDKEKLQEYGKHAGAALQKYVGKVVGRSTNLTALDGPEGALDLMVILAFPSEEQALAWRNDPELTEIHNLRNASGDWSIQMLGE